MVVNVVECIEGARKAKGLVVIIDVFRAFSVACYAVDNGVEKYFAVGEIDLARKLAADHAGILVGERDCIKVEGFDYGNSPAEIEEIDFSGKTVVHTTSAGTQGLVGAVQADEVITGSFVNAGAIVEYIREQQPEVVTLVAMGTGGSMRAQEDMMCAMYIKNELEDYPNSFETLKKFLASVDSAEKFFDESKEYAPERDFELCMDLDRFDFVLRAEPREDGAVCLSKVTVASA
ncbi:2-phosphosulfolactate phosphatase [uncultured Pseudodesulfovibrio sp.]|uniref:2-phosphosulfolactate phosphatase n=1 Tax=uncultured Pseudodesulfovibrio sp. TaxID=2035858 RepID=UPI0029C7E14D|nr:2-phosphosulfolactate phosphatase [uncultured Pseudodesulfovibrio sp.]